MTRSTSDTHKPQTDLEHMLTRLNWVVGAVGQKHEEKAKSDYAEEVKAWMNEH